MCVIQAQNRESEKLFPNTDRYNGLFFRLRGDGALSLFFQGSIGPFSLSFELSDFCLHADGDCARWICESLCLSSFFKRNKVRDPVRRCGEAVKVWLATSLLLSLEML